MPDKTITTNRFDEIIEAMKAAYGWMGVEYEPALDDDFIKCVRDLKKAIAYLEDINGKN